MKQHRPHKVRTCYNEDGVPKIAYASREDAVRPLPLFSTEFEAYECALHGWHVGHTISQRDRRRIADKYAERMSGTPTGRQVRRMWLARQREDAETS